MPAVYMTPGAILAAIRALQLGGDGSPQTREALRALRQEVGRGPCAERTDRVSFVG
jgi:hypothetical protein